MAKLEKRGVRRAGFNGWSLLLLLPYIGVLSVPFYARSRPVLLGFPFFYWYQLLWVPLTALLIGWVYWRSR